MKSSTVLLSGFRRIEIMGIKHLVGHIHRTATFSMVTIFILRTTHHDSIAGKMGNVS